MTITMRKNRPNQHTHNWKLKFTRMGGLETLPDIYERFKEQSFGGFYGKKYWACIRGNKVKHTFSIPEPAFQQKDKQANFFIMGSGIPYSQHRIID